MTTLGAAERVLDGRDGLTAPRGRVIRITRITRDIVRASPDTLFVFGDNMERRGLGGQAGAMRGERNAIGVPTKWRPTREESAYFTDADWPGEVERAIREPFYAMRATLLSGRDVVVPADGLGTGLAELPARAPRIHAFIERSIRKLEGFA